MKSLGNLVIQPQSTSTLLERPCSISNSIKILGKYVNRIKGWVKFNTIDSLIIKGSLQKKKKKKV